MGTIEEALKKIFTVDSEKERLEFELIKRQLTIMFKVEDAMVAQQLNRKQFAEKVGISSGYLNNMFSTDYFLNKKIIKRFEDALNIEIDETDKNVYLEKLKALNVIKRRMRKNGTLVKNYKNKEQ